MRRLALLAVLLAALAATTGVAYASFPYGTHSAPTTGNPNPQDYHLTNGQFPDDLTGDREWMYSATPGTDNAAFAADPRELNGVRGAHIVDKTAAPDVAWETTTGRPDVTLAVLDSGIRWDDPSVMVDTRRKIRLNKGELPKPRTGRGTSGHPGPIEDGVDCSTYKNEPDDYDANGDGVFNVLDYACDLRVERDPALRAAPPAGVDHPSQPRGVGPSNMLDPEDVIIAFSDGTDGDHNGYKDDIAGWDFLDDDNDAYDDVHYDHGSGEIRDSTGEANNNSEGGALGACPNCTSIPLRVGDSFVADVNNFAKATTYAVDNHVSVVQEALGTLNNSTMATQAVNYAYNHGVTVIASAADEAAQHNNWPSSNPHVILVNSVTKYATQEFPPHSGNDVIVPGSSPSYLSFNGCTNFNAKVTLAIPSVSCSSDATGRGSGMAGLVYSAALNAHDAGRLGDHPHCKRADGSPCVISANEVRQLMASGTVGGKQTSDDVDFTGGTDTESCAAPVVLACTDPFASAPTSNARLPGMAGAQSYPARKGHDQFYGYGRANMNTTVKDADQGVVPPEAEIESPDWYAFVDPDTPTLDVRGHVGARGAGGYSCELLVAPGSYPNNGKTTDTPPGDFKPVGNGHCNGSHQSGDSFDGVLGTIDINDLKSRFPGAPDFHGAAPLPSPATHNGRPNTDPYGFVVKVVTTATSKGHDVTGEDERNLRLNKNSKLLSGFPRDLGGDGASSPAFADLNGDNRNELILAGSDGFVHAYERDGSELPGWPVKGDPVSVHPGSHAFQSGEVSHDFGAAMLGSVAVGDLNHDGSPEVVADDLEGHLYVWNAQGHRVLTKEANPNWSGKPLHPFEVVRDGKRFRTQHGFFASPVLADVDHNDGGKLEIVAAGMDRHLYVWNDDGSDVKGFPVLLVDRSKIDSVNPTTHAPHFTSDAGDELNQGSVVDTPAVGQLTGDSRPEIVVGTNEEYSETMNASPFPSDFTLQIASAALGSGNSRVFAVSPDGDKDGNPLTDDFEISGSWPFKAGVLEKEVLPVVGEGVTAGPVIGSVDCGSGAQNRVGVTADAGPGYILDPNGQSCLGKDSGMDRPLSTDSGAQVDHPAVPAFGQPALADFGLGGGKSFLAPAVGIQRALDIALPEYQSGGQDFIGAWKPQAGGQFQPNFPATMNDLQFLTGPSVGELDGNDADGQEVVSASASLDLEGYNSAGLPIDSSWPKLTSDWVVANPLLGSWGTLDTDPGAKKVVFEITRSGFELPYDTAASACSPSSWPRFRHDNGNTGYAAADMTLPGKPMDASLFGSTLSWKAPGDDLLCGKADHYEVVSSDNGQITTRSFRSEQSVSHPPPPRDPGTAQNMQVPAGAQSVGIRAVDDAGNVGPMAVVSRGRGAGGGSTHAKGSIGCLNSRGGARGKRLGPAALGRTRARQRRSFRGKRLRARGGIDRYCAAGGGSFRIGYPTRRLNRGIGRRLRTRVRGRAVLIITSSKRFSVDGVRPGTSVRTLRRRVRGERRLRVGGNTWYVTRSHSIRHVFKTRGRRVLEVGLGDLRLSRSRSAVKRFLRAWQLR